MARSSTSFAPGRSGNPGGRPKSKDFAEALRIELNEADGDTTKLRKLAAKLVQIGMDGDLNAIREIADRIDGKPTQDVGVEVQEDRTVTVSWLTAERDNDRERAKSVLKLLSDDKAEGDELLPTKNTMTANGHSRGLANETDDLEYLEID